MHTITKERPHEPPLESQAQAQPQEKQSYKNIFTIENIKSFSLSERSMIASGGKTLLGKHTTDSPHFVDQCE
jgi:hypothetical protein